MPRLKVYTRYQRSPMSVGAKKSFIGEIQGPASVLAGSDTISYQDFLFNREIHHISFGLSNSGTYMAAAYKANAGPQETWIVKFFTANGGAIVADAVDLSAEYFPFRAEGI
jgi:hypothetical protein